MEPDYFLKQKQRGREASRNYYHPCSTTRKFTFAFVRGYVDYAKFALTFCK